MPPQAADWSGLIRCAPARKPQRGTTAPSYRYRPICRCLTPEYQQRFVQEMYHYSGSNAPQWPGSYCWPEGFMRRLAQYGGGRINLGRDARSGARHAQRGEDADHADPHRPPIQGRRQRPAAPRARRAAVVRRNGQLLGRRSVDQLDLEHPGLDQPRRRRSSATSCSPSRSTRRARTRAASSSV